MTNAGKQHIVDKTLGKLMDWRQIAAYWPDARYLMLTRHLGDILASALASAPPEHALEPLPLILSYPRELHEAIGTLNGLVVSYEDLTTQPETKTARICAYLGVEWGSAIYDYGRQDHSPFQFGIGDFGDKVRSGRNQPAQGPPGPIPPSLRHVAAHLGYLNEQAAA